MGDSSIRFRDDYHKGKTKMENNSPAPDHLIKYVISTHFSWQSAKIFRDKNLPEPVRVIYRNNDIRLCQNLPKELVDEINGLAFDNHMQGWYALQLTIYSNGILEVYMWKNANENFKYVSYARPVEIPYTREYEQYIYG